MSVAQITHLTVLIEISPQEVVEDSEIECYTVGAHYEPSIGKWLVDASGEDFLLLSSDVLDALVTEAFVKGYPVRYMDSRGQFLRI